MGVQMRFKGFKFSGALVLLLSFTVTTATFAAPPTGAAKPNPFTQDQMKGDFALIFTEANAGGSYKPVFSGIIEYPDSKGYVSVLPNCQNDPGNPCVKSFEASIDNGKTWIQSATAKTYAAKTFDQSKYPAGSYIVQTRNWVGEEKTLLPSGTDSSVFSFPKAPHHGGPEYLLQPIIEGVSSTQNVNAKAHKLSLSIIPIKTYTAPNPNNCSLWITTCFDLFNFKAETTFRVVLDLKYLAPTFSGWFQSRVKNSEIQQLSSTEFAFSGSAITVSSVIAEFSKPYPEALIAAYPNVKTGFILEKYPYWATSVTSNTNAAIKDWITFENSISKQAKWESSIWSAVSYSTATSSFIYTQMNGCLQSSKGLLGQVSTNATVYTISAPLWDATTDSLSFTVASPTFESDGDKKQGLYDLVLREDVAKCLWGKNLLNTNAVIEVLNSDGTVQVATTTFKVLNGYVYFRAAGFHFSVPKIKVSIVEPTPTPTPSASAVAIKKKTITCIKGKVSKKVTASKPKCPAGYKKAA
jgi:hypothetical protein